MEMLICNFKALHLFMLTIQHFTALIRDKLLSDNPMQKTTCIFKQMAEFRGERVI